MATKPKLAGTTKLAAVAAGKEEKKTKVNEKEKAKQTPPLTQEPEEPLNLIQKKKKTVSKTYRFLPSDIERLAILFKAVNMNSERQYSETTIMRALIAMGEGANPEKIIKWIREVA